MCRICKKKRVLSLLLAILLLLPQTIILASAEGQNQGFLDSVKITHENGSSENSYEIWETVKITYEWSIKDHKKGDIIEFKFPREFELINDINFNLNTTDGKLLGVVSATTSGDVTIRLDDPTDYISKNTNIKGTLFFEVRFNREYVKVGEKNILEFEINDKVQKIEINLGDEDLPNKDEILDKWGEINKADGKINWTIRVNYARQKIDNMKLDEILGKGQQLESGSVSIFEVKFNYNTGEAIREKDVTDKFEITERTDGFSIDFGNVNRKGYYVKFVAEMTDDTLPEYENTVKVTGSNIEETTITVEERTQNGGGDGEGNSRKTSVHVTKEWLGPKKDSVTVKLMNGDQEVASQVLNEGNKWQHTFTGLDKYDATGAEIQYTIAEVQEEGYDSQITGSMADGFVVTNVNTAKISIPVTKQWVGQPAKSVEVILHADDVQKETVTLSQATGWEHVFKDLAKYDSNDGHEIKYTVTETPVEGYTTTVTGDATQGFTITNTITGKVSVGVTKKWVGPAKNSVTVKLMNGDQEVASQVLNEGNKWQHTFAGLDKYDATGAEIQYTIAEVQEEGYDSQITGSMADGFVVTNVNTAKISIPVTKQWVGQPANAIKVTLFADGVKQQTATIKKTDGWKHTFLDLPKYTAEGKEIIYTVQEEPITGYTAVISGTAQDGFILINSQNDAAPTTPSSTPTESSTSPEPVKDTGHQVHTDHAPVTGDNTNMILYLLLMFISASGTGVLLILKKARHK